MNNDQLTVKRNLDPLLAICGFLKDALTRKITHVESDAVFVMTPDIQEPKLIALQQTADELNVVKQKLESIHTRLVEGNILNQSSLETAHPDFIADMERLRNELIETFQANL